MDKITISEEKTLNFIAWCHHFTQFNSNLTSQAITAAVSFYKDDGISLDRKQHTSIRKLVVGHQSFRPPDYRMKLPLSEHHIQQIFIYFFDVDEYESSLPGFGMFIGYSLILEPGELVCQPRVEEKIPCNVSIT